MAVGMGVIEMGIILAVLALPFLFVIVMVLLLVKLGKGERHSTLNGGEAKIIQEIHLGLARMEQRIEALETILLERKGMDQ